MRAPRPKVTRASPMLSLLRGSTKAKPSVFRSLLVFLLPAVALLYLTVSRTAPSPVLSAVPLEAQLIGAQNNTAGVSAALAQAAAEEVVRKTSVAGAQRETQKRRFCDASSAERPCIFDVGLNSGQDTAGYLNDANARVVAVEANPTLVAAAHRKFASAIAAGRLLVVHAGLTAVPAAGRPAKAITFWVNTVNDKFGSFIEALGCRSRVGAEMELGDHRNCRKMSIEPKSCLDLLREFGTPSYMKIDIEGMDRACLHALKHVEKAQRPTYVSVENVFAWDVDTLAELGYTRFKVVNQAVLEAREISAASDRRGHSGPWGELAVDNFVGLQWHTPAQVKAVLPLPENIVIGGRTWKAWFDLHAAMPSQHPNERRSIH